MRRKSDNWTRTSFILEAITAEVLELHRRQVHCVTGRPRASDAVRMEHGLRFWHCMTCATATQSETHLLAVNAMIDI